MCTWIASQQLAIITVITGVFLRFFIPQSVVTVKSTKLCGKFLGYFVSVEIQGRRRSIAQFTANWKTHVRGVGTNLRRVIVIGELLIFLTYKKRNGTPYSDGFDYLVVGTRTRLSR